MRTFVASLTAALLLVHAVVGCCRHHEHKTGSNVTVAEAVDSSATACCHHEHPCGHDEDHPAPAPCDCKLECKSLCIYLPPEKHVVDAGDLRLSWDVALAPHGDVAKTQAEAATGALYLAHSRATAESEPPLRLHLLYQIILV